MQKFNMLTMIEPSFIEGKKRKVKVRCDCGVEKIIDYYGWKSGHTKSCGCYNKLVAKQRMSQYNNSGHGLVNHPLYQSWKSMKSRTNDICSDWLEFKPFYDWAIHVWKEKLVLTRKNFSLPYSPENCIFVTKSEIACNNSRKSKHKRVGIKHSVETIEKREQTNLIKYGYSTPFQSPETKEKIRQTNFNKYGVFSPSKSELIKEKTRQNNRTKYGVDYPQQLAENRLRSKQKTIDNGQAYILDVETTDIWSSKLGISRSGLNARIRKYGFDQAIKIGDHETEIESIVRQILEKNNITYLQDFKVGNKIADFCLSDYKLLLECDGLYWHCDAVNTNKYYHRDKKILYSQNGYDSLFFREDEINSKPHIIESMIKHRTIGSSCIGASKCKIMQITKKEGKEFLNHNHLMGNGRGNCFGLFYKNELYTVIQIKMHLGNMEISRFCHKLDHVVKFGFSRLLHHLINIYKPNSVINFIDARYGNGSYLEKLGFIKINEDISFRWVKDNQSYHRLKYRGQSGYDNRCYKIYDCGQIKWQKFI